MFGIRKRLLGHMVCQMDGGQCHRVMNICRKKRIYLWDIQTVDGCVKFCILASDYDPVKDIVAQCGGSLLVCERKGLPYFIEKNKKHSGFAAGIFLAALCIYGMSLYIWNVEIAGNSYYTESTINQFLNEIGAGCGALKKKIVPSKVEEEMRIRYPFISWVSVQIIGTRLIVAVEEGVINENTQADLLGDITAIADGTVVSIMTRKGTPLVHAGDEVKAGDVLIRGSVDVIGDDLSVVESINTGADGDIYLKIQYPVSQKFDRTYAVKDYTGNEQKQTKIQIMGHNLQFGGNSEGYEVCDTISHLREFRLTSNFYLPVTVEETVVREYVWKKEKYTDVELQSQMDNYINTVIENIENMEGRVLENHTDVQIYAGFGQIAGYLTAEVKNTVNAD